MIEYSKTVADTKHRIRELTWLNGRIFVILGAVALLISAFNLFAGFVANESAAISLGFRLLTVAVVAFAVYLILYVKTKKAVTLNFDNFAEDGKIDFTLERVGDTLQFTRLADGEFMSVKRQDIRSIKQMKHINVILLKNKKTIDLPKRDDIDEMIRF